VHQTECIFTMVTLIAGPHFTLEGPDSFLQSHGCIVEYLLIERFSRWPPLLLTLRPLFFTPVQANARTYVNSVSHRSRLHKFSLANRGIRSRYRVERQDYLTVLTVNSYLVCKIQSVLYKLAIHLHLSLRQHR
jgi:hypothetical protein